MLIRNVYVVFNPYQWTVEAIKRDLMREGFSHNFYIADKQHVDERHRKMDYAEEVWTFGKCDSLYDYKHALVKGKDLWKMG